MSSLQFYSPDCEISPAEASQFDWRHWAHDTAVTYNTFVLIFEVALGIPRRLGGQATGRELADDKQSLRRLLHLYTQMRERWLHFSGMPLTFDAKPSREMVSFGAQVLVPEWIPLRLDNATRCRTEFVTITQQKGITAQRNSGCALYTLEISSLQRVASLLPGQPE